MEQGDHGERSDLGHHPHRADRADGRDYVDRIADKHPQSERQLFAENDAWFFNGCGARLGVIGRSLHHFHRGKQVEQPSRRDVLGEFGDLGFSFRIDPAEDDSLYSTLRGEQDLAEYERRGGDDIGHRLDLVDQTVIVGHVLFHPLLDDDMCGRAENLALNVFSETGHDADRTDQRRDPQRNPCNRYEGVQRDRPVAALGAQVAESDEDFIGEGHYDFSGLSCGKSTTSRMEA